MRYTHTSHILFTLSLVIAVATSPMVAASDIETERGFPDDPGVNRLFNIPGAGFNSAGHHDADVYFFSFGHGRIEGDADALHFGCIMAPATLPDGYVLYQFYASLYDNDPADYVWMDFWRLQNYTGVTEKIGRIVTTSDGSGVQSIGEKDIPAAFQEIDALNYSYYAVTCLGNDSQGVYSARFWYRPVTVFTDGFETGNTNAWSTATP